MGLDPLGQRQPTELENSPLQEMENLEKLSVIAVCKILLLQYCRVGPHFNQSGREVVKVKFIHFAFTN